MGSLISIPVLAIVILYLGLYKVNKALLPVTVTGLVVAAGFAIVNWNTAADGSGTAYSAGQSYAVSGGATIFYATWQIQTSSGAGNNGGTAPTSNQTDGGTLTDTGMDLTSIILAAGAIIMCALFTINQPWHHLRNSYYRQHHQ